MIMFNFQKIVKESLSLFSKRIFLLFLPAVFSLGAQPTISSFSPTSAIAGATITLTGSGFNTTAANNTVWLGGIRCTVNSVSSATSMSITLPQTIIHDRFYITNTATRKSGHSITRFVPKYSSTVGYSYASTTIKANQDTTLLQLTSGLRRTGNQNSKQYQIADMNADGYADIVAFDDNGKVLYYRNKSTAGSISFHNPTTLLTVSGVTGWSGYEDPGLRLADFDSDGDLDVAVYAYYGYFVRFYENTTSGSTVSFNSTAMKSHTGGDFGFEPDIVDFDSDGTLDYFITRTSGFVVINNDFSTSTTPNFASTVNNVNWTTGTISWTSVYGGSILNIDGNASLDVVLQNSSDLHQIINNVTTAGSTVTTSNVSLSRVVATGGRRTQAADLNNDGKEDIAILGSPIRIYQNTTSGTTPSFSTTAVSLTPHSNGYTNIAYMDMNNDSYLDVVIFGGGAPAILYLNTTSSAGGTISFGSSTTISSSTSGSASANLNAGENPYIADFDLDGYPDFVAVNNDIIIYRNLHGEQPQAILTQSLTTLIKCGTTITPQSFTVSGSYLTGDLIVNAPTNFEVSTSSSGTYAASVTLTQSSGVVSTTTIWIRLKSTVANGTYSGVNITLTNGVGGTTLKTQAVTGTANTAPTLNGGATDCYVVVGYVNYLTFGTWAWPHNCTSSNTAIATVDNSGTIRGISSGTATITYVATSGCSTSIRVNVQPRDYYPVASGASSINSLASWNSNANGTGVTPGGFLAGMRFYLNQTGTTTSYTLPANNSWSIVSGASIEIASGVTLTLGSNAALSVGGTFVNNGTIALGASGSLNLSSSVTNTGSITGDYISIPAGTNFGGSLDVKRLYLGGDNVVLSTNPTKIGLLTLGGNFVMTQDLNLTTGLSIGAGKNLDLNGLSLNVTGLSGFIFGSATSTISAGTSASPKVRSRIIYAPTSTSAHSIRMSSTANTIKDLEIGNGTVSATLTLLSSINIKGGDNKSGTIGVLKINNNGKLVIPTGTALTLKSDTCNGMLDLGRAATSAIECTGTGQFKIERDHFGKRGWRIYSHPFNNSISLAQIADDIEVISPKGTAEGFFDNVSTNTSAYWYDYSMGDSSMATDTGWTPFTSAKGTLISGNANTWKKVSPIILFNPGTVRGTGGFTAPSTATYADGKISLDYTLSTATGGVHLNDGSNQTIATGTLNAGSRYFYICNPYTAPIKLSEISGLNTTNCEKYFYYWKQRRNAVTTTNFMPAQWQSDLISNGNTTRDNNICIPAFGAILVKLKSTSSVSFGITESSKQLTNFTYMIGGANGISKTNLMFMERAEPMNGDGGIELELLINDSQSVDRTLVYDMLGESVLSNVNDAPKYIDITFPNIYTMSGNNKALSIDMQDIQARLKTAGDEVEIPLVVAADAEKRFSKLYVRVIEKNSPLEMYFKNTKTGKLTNANQMDVLTLDMTGVDEVKNYSLVFRRNTSSTQLTTKLPMLSINPVPAADFIELRRNVVLLNNQDFTIYDLMGRVVMSGTCKESITKVDISTLGSGQYILKVGFESVKFIKN
jgi:hypothetical protein